MSKIQILIIDDEADVCTFFSRLLRRKGYEVVTATCEADALKALDRGSFSVALVDLKLPDTDGITLLQLIKARQKECEVIIMTGYSTIQTAVKAIQYGAYEYLEKPFEDIEEIEALVEKASRNGESAATGEGGEEWDRIAGAIGFMVGTSPAMRRMVSLAYKIASKNISVLIQGETGTGKEVLARFVHTASGRSDQMFIPVNCGALPENLLESELFGHERGAFTGAANQRKGIFELANRGTLFLDEIGDASPSIQVKLLRILETGEFMRVGGEKQIHTDVRFVSATNVDLRQGMRDKTFREDLFYRLNVVNLEIPPLRQRKEDIPMLAEHFVRLFNPSLSIAPETLEMLTEYRWPGNIRELANTLRQAAVLCDDGQILPIHLAGKLSGGLTDPVPASDTSPASSPDAILNHYGRQEVLGSMETGELSRMLENLNDLERRVHQAMKKKGIAPPAGRGLKESEVEMITQALEEHRWNITEVAKVLGIARNTLHRKINKYNLRG